ncbi:MAG TPA: DUF1203 domain-containing protein [Actinophytocola sp.]|uniref:DUF1203 domain-containing protein n=1 Tax=Actinophytocola sp. TaxID=1872138 RepID=UPI002DB89DFA|nr:DUF1203 domain-containing protein [Actinophytocola sp.]HEU5471190.1 DUF1203 domain-containing protein [Actinophytocola sp.]
MTDIEYVAIEPERLDRMRQRGADEHGNPWTPRVCEGWEPLRCCLRIAEPGSEIVLIGYTPRPEAGAWAETGPVFVHFGRCTGYPTPGDYPEAFRRSRSTVQPFDHTGARAYQHIAVLEPEDDHAAAVRRVLDQPEVAYAHVRSATAACFTFEARAVR